MQCKASVIQIGNNFTVGLHGHCHCPHPGAAKVHVICSELKRSTRQNIFTSAAVIAEEILNEEIQSDDEVLDGLPSVENIARATNRKQEQSRPQKTLTLF